MARKGDIDSKSVASRVPMEVYLRLLKNSSSKGMTLSSYLCDVLSEENFGQGGQPINVRVPIQDPILIREINTLKEKVVEHGNFLLKIIHIEEVKKELEKSSLKDITFHLQDLKTIKKR
jgi:hypothetical protein